MWNLDRAFSEVGRLRKFRYLAFRQTKYGSSFQRGPTLTTFFKVDDERERSRIPLKVVHNWPSNETPFKSPAKRHLNGVLLVNQWWPNIKNAGLEVL